MNNCLLSSLCSMHYAICCSMSIYFFSSFLLIMLGIHLVLRFQALSIGWKSHPKQNWRHNHFVKRLATLKRKVRYIYLIEFRFDIGMSVRLCAQLCSNGINWAIGLKFGKVLPHELMLRVDLIDQRTCLPCNSNRVRLCLQEQKILCYHNPRATVIKLFTYILWMIVQYCTQKWKKSTRLTRTYRNFIFLNFCF